MIQGHGGNIFETAERLRCAPSEIIDMSSNVNPLGPMPELVEHLRKILPEAISVLPRVDSADIVGLFARRYNLDPFCALASNGSTQLIYDIPRAFETKKAIILGPTYADYADACRMQGVSFDEFFAEEDDGFVPDLSRFGDNLSSADTAFICNPNNPTGALIPARQLRDLCSAHPRVRFVVDESYLPFAPEGERQSMAGCGLGNVVVLNSMSKIYRLPGLRQVAGAENRFSDRTAGNDSKSGPLSSAMVCERPGPGGRVVSDDTSAEHRCLCCKDPRLSCRGKNELCAGFE